MEWPLFWLVHIILLLVFMFDCRYKSRIRGLFSAITGPTSVGPIITHGGFQEKLFLCMSFAPPPSMPIWGLFVVAVLHKLISSGQLRGSLHGHGDKSTYTPGVYIHMQNKWADSFFSSNGYLGKIFDSIQRHNLYVPCFVEYDALKRLGIDDPQGYIVRRYSILEKKVLQLATCAIGETALRELEGAVEDIHDSEVEWIDVLVSDSCATYIPTLMFRFCSHYFLLRVLLKMPNKFFMKNITVIVVYSYSFITLQLASLLCRVVMSSYPLLRRKRLR